MPNRSFFNITNSNHVTGNATVGSQTDSTSDGRTDKKAAEQVARAAEQVARAAERAARATERARARGASHTTNEASGDDHVSRQVGFQFGRRT
ncbi:MAG: hypothetical protein M3548_09730 [Actinomycetota bacterium]|nr:hypothetical protein [Actinomycetota bacterium]